MKKKISVILIAVLVLTSFSGQGIEAKKKKNHGFLKFLAGVGLYTALDCVNHEMAKKVKEKGKGKHN